MIAGGRADRHGALLPDKVLDLIARTRPRWREQHDRVSFRCRDAVPCADDRHHAVDVDFERRQQMIGMDGLALGINVAKSVT